MSNFINDATFKSIIEHTPLVSLDLLVKNNGKILLGKRVNKPAKDLYFTLGGRILKNEKISDTLHRIAKEELSAKLIGPSKFIGVFEHFYDDSIYDSVSTHYVNLVYEVQIDNLHHFPEDQHNEYRWFTINELLESDDVHRYIKDIFTPQKGTVPDQSRIY